MRHSSVHTISASRHGSPARGSVPARAFTLVEIMIVVVIIGILASLAYPFYKRINERSQDSAILNNARQLSAAANQYFLEHGVNSVAYTKLVGVDGYIKTINTIAKESYPSNFTLATPITISDIAGARTITYNP